MLQGGGGVAGREVSYTGHSARPSLAGLEWADGHLAVLRTVHTIDWYRILVCTFLNIEDLLKGFLAGS
jgi:hypothetical protein